jgi:hypothetical protein
VRPRAARTSASASDAVAAAAPGAALQSRQRRDRPQNRPSGQPWCPDPDAPRPNPGQLGDPAALPPRSPRDGSNGQQRAATSEIPERPQRQADNSVRPLRRRAAMIARPARVRMRNRNPWVFARRRLFGWNVRLPLVTAVRSPGTRFSLRGRSRRDCAVVGSSPASTGGTLRTHLTSERTASATGEGTQECPPVGGRRPEPRRPVAVPSKPASGVTVRATRRYIGGACLHGVLVAAPHACPHVAPDSG